MEGIAVSNRPPRPLRAPTSAVRAVRARARRFFGRDALADLTQRVARLESAVADDRHRLARLEEHGQDTRLRVDVTQEAMLLAEASRLVPKKPVIVLVEAAAQYGNLTALARALTAELGTERVVVLARDAASAARWDREGVRAHAWTTAPGVGAAESWSVALSAAVSVYEHHDWWREPDRLVRRGLLAGSQKVQVWHGSSSGWGKEVALLTTPGAPGMLEFAGVTTTAVGYEAFVCEPRIAVKRAQEFQFERHVADVDFRMVAPLRRDAARPRQDGPPRVLIAPTYPETERAAAVLAERVGAYADVAASSAAEIVLRFHPWTPPSVREAAASVPVLENAVDIYDTIDTFDVLVTDFSSLASDALLLGRRVVLDHSDAAAYLAERSLRRNDDVLACCDVAATAREAITLAADPTTDTRADARAAQARARLDALGPSPGRTPSPRSAISWPPSAEN